MKVPYYLIIRFRYEFLEWYINTINLTKHPRRGTHKATVQASQHLGPGIMEPSMTKEWLRSSCRESGGYVSPPLNDILYLHFKGFARIQNLEEYTQVKSIFLEGNCLEELDGLEHCVNLRCLFAQQNCICGISPTLPTSIATLNVSQNNISILDNIARLPSLQTLSVGCVQRVFDSRTTESCS